MIKAVVFDVGGVLCEWESICRVFAGEAGLNSKEFLDIFIKFSLDPETGSDLGLMTTDEFFAKLSVAVGVPEKAQDWRKRFIPGFIRIEPTYVLVDELKGKYTLALLTNAKIGLWDEWVEGRLKDYFEIIVDSSEVHAVKPNPKIFKILLDRLQLPAEECLFIDDFLEYTTAAEKLGFNTVHFTEPEVGIKAIKNKLGIL
ncbi:HAD family phosphatase [Patescibacteria group bacterium]|nr:HAD family phosphatase [Patescibacteria group bacterium]